MSRRRYLYFALFVSLAAALFFLAIRDRREASTEEPAAPVAAGSAATNQAAPVLLTNTIMLRPFDPRWAGVIGVLESMRDWSEANPVCQLRIVTEGMGGKPYSETEMFRFQEASGTNFITRVRVHLLFPHDVTFLIEKEGEDILAYLPESDQIVKVEAAKELSARFGLDMQNPGTHTFLNLLRVAFVETNAAQRALTFAFKPDVMNTPAAASIDVFTTLRIDDKGALQAIEQMQGGELRVMRVKYVNFRQEDVARAAPEIPQNKPVITGKAFDLALQEEILRVREKGNRI